VDATLSATQFFLNPGRSAKPYGEEHASILSMADGARARKIVASWPGYTPTPLVGLPRLAERLKVASIDYKDEGGRFGLGSFKAIGGAYAVFRVLEGVVRQKTGIGAVNPNDLIAGRYAEFTRAVTVTCATDGNHGRSVAWGAQMFGCACVIYVHATVSDERVRIIEGFGARVVRAPGNYDDAVHQAARDAAENGWVVVSDTSYPGYVEIPRDVMQGYSVMVAEAVEQMQAGGRAPTHVFVQGGVGGLAAAATAQLWEALGPEAPRIVVVEPDKAACLFASARAGEPTRIHGDLDTLMAGLACGEVSVLAWKILKDGATGFMTIPDSDAVAAMRLLASGEAGATVVGGESGVAGLAGLIAFAARADWREAIALNADSHVLLFGTEGDTDPGIYRKLVGRAADQIREESRQ
jgi:diaminopropionate ammonia-lyase